MAPGVAMRTVAVAGLLLVLAGCGAESLLQTKGVDYKTAASAPQRPGLEVPPDLLAPSTSDRYQVPEANSGTATLSELNRQPDAKAAPAVSAVLPQSPDVHIERSGSQRWLVVNQPADALWPVVREFWEEMGFIVAVESEQTGIMETDWAENRARIPQDFIRRTLGKVVDNLYSTPERDRFRVRFEHGTKPGETELFLTHKGAYEVYVEDPVMRRAGTTKWQPRPPDPELEAEMLSRLQVKLVNRQQNAGSKEAAAAASKVTAAVNAPRAVVAKDTTGAPVLRLNDELDRAWRRVGLTLDRLGFTVQDRDRDAGFYDVRYLDTEKETKKTGLSRLAFWQGDPDKGKPKDFRVALSRADTGTQVQVVGRDGKVDRSETADRILRVLEGDLR